MIAYSKQQRWLNKTNSTYCITIIPIELSGSSHTSATLQIGANSLSWSVTKFWKLSIASIQNLLNFILWLFRNGNLSVQVFIHKESTEHLNMHRKHIYQHYVKNMCKNLCLSQPQASLNRQFLMAPYISELWDTQHLPATVLIATKEKLNTFLDIKILQIV